MTTISRGRNTHLPTKLSSNAIIVMKHLVIWASMQSKRGIGTVANGKPIVITCFRQQRGRKIDMHITQVYRPLCFSNNTLILWETCRREKKFDVDHLKHLSEILFWKTDTNGHRQQLWLHNVSVLYIIFWLYTVCTVAHGCRSFLAQCSWSNWSYRMIL